MSGRSPLLQQPFEAPPRFDGPLPPEAASRGWTAEKWNALVHKAVCNLQHLEYLSGQLFFPMTTQESAAIKAQCHDINVEMQKAFDESGLTKRLAKMLMLMTLVYPGLKQYLTPEQAAMMVSTGVHNDIADL